MHTESRQSDDRKRRGAGLESFGLERWEECPVLPPPGAVPPAPVAQAIHLCQGMCLGEAA